MAVGVGGCWCMMVGDGGCWLPLREVCGCWWVSVSVSECRRVLAGLRNGAECRGWFGDGRGAEGAALERIDGIELPGRCSSAMPGRRWPRVDAVASWPRNGESLLSSIPLFLSSSSLIPPPSLLQSARKTPQTHTDRADHTDHPDPQIRPSQFYATAQAHAEHPKSFQADAPRNPHRLPRTYAPRSSGFAQACVGRLICVLCVICVACMGLRKHA